MDPGHCLKEVTPRACTIAERIVGRARREFFGAMYKECPCRTGGSGEGAVKVAAQTEVGEVDPTLELPVHQNIRGLDVPVHDLVGVSHFERSRAIRPMTRTIARCRLPQSARTTRPSIPPAVARGPTASAGSPHRARSR